MGWIRIVAAAALAAGVAGCGGDGNSFVQVVIVDETRTLAEGGQVTFPLSVGTYRAEITSSRNGVSVVWVGGTGCSSATETRTYTASCDVGALGALGLVNPTLLGLPGDEVVTIKITRL